MLLDPVCRKALSEGDVETTTVYNGKTYYFCCSSCREQFTRQPKQYIGKSWWKRFLYRLEEANTSEFGGKGPSCHG